MKSQLQSVPSTPGIYKFFSKNQIIYIGKAKNLKKRVSSYFGKSLKDRKTNQIRILTDKIETFSTNSEAEALLLEQSLIKENLPRFNILLRDDKTYPYVHFSMHNKFPAISLKRSKHAVSKNYFGPFISVQAVKSTIKDIQKIFQIRNCSDSTFNNRSRPCIEYQMRRCSAPCVGFIAEENYQTDIFSSQQYLASTGKEIRSLMTSQMLKLADQQDFERANELKKRIANLDLLKQEQSHSSSLISTDIFACTSKLDRTGVCILSIRDGKIRGTKTHYLKGNYLLNTDGLYESLIFSYYQSSFSLPNQILLTPRPSNISLIKEAAKLKFNKSISFTTNINKNTRKVANLAKLNANQAIENRINQSEKYSYAIKDLMSHLGLKKDDILIEGFDVSHHGGKHAVGSSVVFTSDGPQKSMYRLYNIPENLSGNDIGSLKHILERRIKKAYLNDMPEVILIDGGKNQLNIALKTFSEHDVSVPMILSIVKGSKRIRSTETILSKNGVIEMNKDNQGFKLLQEVRDESHRFAIRANRKKKLKRVRFSRVELIEGVGPITREKLFKRFKTISCLKKATLNDLTSIKALSQRQVEEIYKNLKKL